jgi:hypothetical protein
VRWRQAFAPTRATSRVVPRTAPRPAAVPLPAGTGLGPPVRAPWTPTTCAHRPAFPTRARCVHPPRRPTSGRAAVLAGVHPRRGRVTCPYRDLYCPNLRLGVQENPQPPRSSPIKSRLRPSSREAAPPSRHCRCQRRQRRARSSSRLYHQCMLLRPALGLPVATLLAYCSDRAANSPEFELPRPSPGKPCRARAPACSPSQWTLVTYPLGHTEALCAAFCSAGPFPSPDFAPPRLCCPGAAAAARRRPLRPSYRRQSLWGEPNRLPHRSFAYPCMPSPPASSSSLLVHAGGKGRT